MSKKTRAGLSPQPLASLNPGAEYGPISLEIAITGHRDLLPDDTKRHEAALKEIFESLRNQYQHSRLLLLTGLAVGADTIAARVALRKGIGYVAVLPMPHECYRTDFNTEASDQEFEYLLGKAERVVELPVAEGSTLEDITDDGPARDQQYEKLGRFLVNYSQVLVAIWDQDYRIKKGGTAHVVSLKLRHSHTKTSFAPLNASGAGPVYIIPARRASPISSGAPLGPRREDYPRGSSAADYEQIYRLIDDFNKDAVSRGPRLHEQIVASRKGLLASAAEDVLQPTLRWLADVYSISDVLSARFRDRSDHVEKCAFLSAALAIPSLVGFHAFHWGMPALFAYYVLLAVAGAMVLFTSRGNLQRRYLDYRALAEALRVQFFWTVIGLPTLAPDHYLEKQAGEVSWIRDALSECALYGGTLIDGTAAEGAEPLRYEFARSWIEGQMGFFARRIAQKQSMKRYMWTIAGVFAVVGVVTPVVSLFVPATLEPAFNATAVLALAWASLVFSYVEMRGYSQESREYQRMYELFRQSDEDVEDCLRTSNFATAASILRQLGRAALAENGEWLLLHRERKLSLKDVLK
jgi:hypothetical protein